MDEFRYAVNIEIQKVNVFARKINSECVCVCVYTWHDYFKKNGDRNKEMKEETGVILRFHVMILQCKMRDWGGCTYQDK